MKFRPFKQEEMVAPPPVIYPEVKRSEIVISLECAFCEKNKAQLFWRGTSICRECQKEKFRTGEI